MDFYYQVANEIKQGSAADFYSLTGARWIDCIQAVSDNYIPVISHIDREFNSFLFPIYNAYKKRGPKLYLRPGPSKGCHSVHALEPIAKGSIVCEYVGEWVGTTNTFSNYRWGPIDAINLRNCSSIIEDGFPNLGAYHLYHVDQIPLRILFIALEEIPADTILTINYGMNHSVKIYEHTEYRIDNMYAFFERNPIKKVLKRINELRYKMPRELGWKRCLELDNLTTKLRYLFQTPSALLSFLLQDAAPVEEIFYHYQKPDFRYFIINYPLTPNHRQKEIISYIGMIKNYFECSNRKADDILLELLPFVRQRILFSVYILGIIEGKKAENLKIETLIWNEAYTAVQQANQSLLAFKLTQANNLQALILSLHRYAQEIRSPLLSYIETLCNPELPFPTAG